MAFKDCIKKGLDRQAGSGFRVLAKQATLLGADDDIGLSDAEIDDLVRRRQLAQSKQLYDAELQKLKAERAQLAAERKKLASQRQPRRSHYSALNQDGPIRLSASRGIVGPRRR